ncbi:hypothetical protein NDU88_002625 [Pleurodeles waltl]|uniref:Uncharacterized protein n=1 Tax=Pleurodeles waltl TaxID=8319 RepID=A0AAV7Q785_PLEWA|nr:hypothetical protein NDU88_002625 [Pleurodeles waltl]
MVCALSTEWLIPKAPVARGFGPRGPVTADAGEAAQGEKAWTWLTEQRLLTVNQYSQWQSATLSNASRRRTDGTKVHQLCKHSPKRQGDALEEEASAESDGEQQDPAKTGSNDDREGSLMNPPNKGGGGGAIAHKIHDVSP